jgi:hypothetical protein
MLFLVDRDEGDDGLPKKTLVLTGQLTRHLPTDMFPVALILPRQHHLNTLAPLISIGVDYRFGLPDMEASQRIETRNQVVRSRTIETFGGAATGGD